MTDLSEFTKELVRIRAGYQCQCMGQYICPHHNNGIRCPRMHSQFPLEIDHIKPSFAGGTDDDENLQALCNACHKEKNILDRITFSVYLR